MPGVEYGFDMGWLGVAFTLGEVAGTLGLGGAGACFFVPLRTMNGLGPFGLEVGVPTLS